MLRQRPRDPQSQGARVYACVILLLCVLRYDVMNAAATAGGTAAKQGEFDLVVVNGTVLWRGGLPFTAAAATPFSAAAAPDERLAAPRMERVDIGVRGGRIVAIAPDLLAAAAASGEAPPPRIIDGRGCLVLPGGVDTHCHIEQRTSTGLTPCDDFRSASVCALAGGTTTIVPFACQHRGQRVHAVVQEYRQLAAKALCDVALHIIVTDPGAPNCLADLEEAYAQGISSVKVCVWV